MRAGLVSVEVITMRTRLTRTAVLILVAACAVSPQPTLPGQATPSAAASATPAPTPAPTPTANRLIAMGVAGMLIVVPASWHEFSPKLTVMPFGPFLFVSNVPIADPCPLEFRGRECWKPLAELPPDGILMTFHGSAFGGIEDSTIVHQLAVSTDCRDIGGEREVDAWIGTFGIVACLRGPDLAASEALTVQLVTSLRLQHERRLEHPPTHRPRLN